MTITKTCGYTNATLFGIMADSPGGYSPVLYSVGKKTAAPYI